MSSNIVENSKKNKEITPEERLYEVIIQELRPDLEHNIKQFLSNSSKHPELALLPFKIMDAQEFPKNAFNIWEVKEHLSEELQETLSKEGLSCIVLFDNEILLVENGRLDKILTNKKVSGYLSILAIAYPIVALALISTKVIPEHWVAGLFLSMTISLFLTLFTEYARASKGPYREIRMEARLNKEVYKKVKANLKL